MQSENFLENNVVGVAMVPKTVANSAAPGSAIAEPWKIGRVLTFLLQAAAMASGDVLTVTVQGLKRSDGATWEAITDIDGNALVFTAAKTSDGGVMENGVVYGSIPIAKMDSVTYKSIRITAINAVAQNVVCSAAYVISDLFAAPPVQVDDLLSKVAQYATTD